jgi:hypothetical protein
MHWVKFYPDVRWIAYHMCYIVPATTKRNLKNCCVVLVVYQQVYIYIVLIYINGRCYWEMNINSTDVQPDVEIDFEFRKDIKFDWIEIVILIEL